MWQGRKSGTRICTLRCGTVAGVTGRRRRRGMFRHAPCLKQPVTCDDASVAVAPVANDGADGMQHSSILLRCCNQLQLPQAELQLHERIPLCRRPIKVLRLHIHLQARLVGRDAILQALQLALVLGGRRDATTTAAAAAAQGTGLSGAPHARAPGAGAQHRSTGRWRALGGPGARSHGFNSASTPVGGRRCD